MAFTHLDIARLELRVDGVLKRHSLAIEVQTLIAELRAAIRPSKSVAIQLLEQEIERLELRVADLLEANTRYLLRARTAEDALKERAAA